MVGTKATRSKAVFTEAKRGVPTAASVVPCMGSDVNIRQHSLSLGPTWCGDKLIELSSGQTLRR